VCLVGDVGGSLVRQQPADGEHPTVGSSGGAPSTRCHCGFQTRITSGDAQKIEEGEGGRERTRGGSIVRKPARDSGGFGELR
jgi:hypothetical protein